MWRFRKRCVSLSVFSWWGPKVLMVVGLAVAAFFIPNSFFLGFWGYVALIGAFVFIIIQVSLPFYAS